MTPRALTEGPQTIQRRGVEVVAVISMKDLERLLEPRGSLVEFLGASPLRGLRLDLKRDKDTGRTLDLGPASRRGLDLKPR